MDVGPHFLDKVEDGTLLHFVISPFSLNKDGESAEWTTEAQTNYIRPAVYCTGMLRKFAEKDLKLLADVAKIQLTFKYKGVQKD